MYTPKIGDRIKMVARVDGYMHEGFGRIISLNRYYTPDSNSVAVLFDNPNQRGMHELSNSLPSFRGYNLSPRSFEAYNINGDVIYNPLVARTSGFIPHEVNNTRELYFRILNRLNEDGLALIRSFSTEEYLHIHHLNRGWFTVEQIVDTLNLIGNVPHGYQQFIRTLCRGPLVDYKPSWWSHQKYLNNLGLMELVHPQPMWGVVDDDDDNWAPPEEIGPIDPDVIVQEVGVEQLEERVIAVREPWVIRAEELRRVYEEIARANPGIPRQEIQPWANGVEVEVTQKPKGIIKIKPKKEE